MTKPKPSRYRVEAFGPELLGILLKGARERLEIPCPDQRTMKFLQFRLHLLRRTMATEHHPQAGVVARARTLRQWNREAGKDIDCRLIVQPHDMEFAALARKAGVDMSISHDLLADIDSGPIGPEEPEAPLVPFDPYAKFKGE